MACCHSAALEDRSDTRLPAELGSGLFFQNKFAFYVPGAIIEYLMSKVVSSITESYGIFKKKWDLYSECSLFTIVNWFFFLALDEDGCSSNRVSNQFISRH